MLHHSLQILFYIIIVSSVMPAKMQLQLKCNIPHNAYPDSTAEFNEMYEPAPILKKQTMGTVHKKKDIFSGAVQNTHDYFHETETLLPDGTPWRYETELNTSRLILIGGIVLSAQTIGYIALKDLMYYYPTTKFHTIDFVQDMKIFQQMDKWGHFTHAYFASDLFSRMYRWSGISGNNSILYGSISGWLWILQIEIADGFFEAWGFSWGDLIFNTLGSGFSAAQQLYPGAFGGIQPKVSYHKSEAFKNRTDNKGLKSLIDDYEGATWWLAVNVHHYLSEKIQKDVPAWLKPIGLAIGMSAKGIMQNPHGGERELFIGLDYDLRKIPIGKNSGLMSFLKHTFNMIRLPMPAVKITQGGVWYGLYF